MLKDLKRYLMHEEQLVNKLVDLAQQQQKALVNFDIDSLYDITKFQQDISLSFKHVENNRIELLMKWYNISRNQAKNLSLSQLQRTFKDEDFSEIKNIRKKLKDSLISLNNLNSTNRVLSNRAKNSINEMMKSLSKRGETQVCNVKV